LFLLNFFDFFVANAIFIMVIIILVKTVCDELTCVWGHEHDNIADFNNGGKWGAFPGLYCLVDLRCCLKRSTARSPSAKRKTACLAGGFSHER